MLDIVQIIIAVVISWVLIRIAYAIMMRNEIVRDYTKSIDVPIIKGWVLTRNFTNKKFNTYNPISTNYIELPKSVNRVGGAQFSYSMWIRLDNVAQENLGSRVIFVHGDPNMYEMTKTMGNDKTKMVDFAIKCPLVKFAPNGKDIIVQVNTTLDINQEARIPTVKSPDEAQRHNVFSLIPTKFVLWTFVFEDDVLVGNVHESGCLFKFYVNDFAYYTQRFKGTLRLNKGTFSVLPLVGNDKPIENGYIADLTYYNRALTPLDAKSIMAKGPRDKRFDEYNNNAPFNEPLYITEYNKLDIYNW